MTGNGAGDAAGMFDNFSTESIVADLTLSYKYVKILSLILFNDIEGILQSNFVCN